MASDQTIAECQRDEILVLKSIFDDEFFESNSPSKFNLLIRLDSSHKNIFLFHHQSEEPNEISNLPPVRFHLEFPSTYPEKNPPIYLISCDYLPSSTLIEIADRLDNVWTPNEPIVFTWIELIKEDLAKRYERFYLSSDDDEREDPRIFTNYHRIGWKAIFDQLIEYDRVENSFQFDKSIHICPIW